MKLYICGMSFIESCFFENEFERASLCGWLRRVHASRQSSYVQNHALWCLICNVLMLILDPSPLRNEVSCWCIATTLDITLVTIFNFRCAVGIPMENDIPRLHSPDLGLLITVKRTTTLQKIAFL